MYLTVFWRQQQNIQIKNQSWARKNIISCYEKRQRVKAARTLTNFKHC